MADDSDDEKTSEEILDEITITEEDMSTDRLTELLKHQRIHEVREHDDSFQLITRRGTTITVATPPADNIAGENMTPYTVEIKTGSADTEGLTPETILELGDLVRLKDPVAPTGKFAEFTHGIVVQLLGRFGSDLGHAPRCVSLHLYNPQTNEIYFDSLGHPSLGFYDKHVRSLVLIQKASDRAYNVREIDVAEFIDLEDRV